LLAVRTPNVRYTAPPSLDSLFSEFRLMRNDAIRVALEYERAPPGHRVRDRFHLIELSHCGSSLVRAELRNLTCTVCCNTEDRDVIASKNILMAAPVCAARPPEGSDEVESQKAGECG
jgi:hypothetical protein